MAMRCMGYARVLVATLLCGGLFAACGGGGGGDDDGPQVVSGTGAIQDEIDAYRAILGGSDNGGTPGAQASGRREINWDAVPDEQAAPNFLPSNFFNAPAAPLARGAVFTTSGTGVQVSADAQNPTGTVVRFGNIDLSYEDQFQTFSAERLFSPIDTNVVDVMFFVAGTSTPAVVRGFGAVYTDVDFANDSSFEYFDADGHSLGQFFVPPNDHGLSFLGVAFDNPIVAHVRIVYGNSILDLPEQDGDDVAVMDDFIYGEPQPIP